MNEPTPILIGLSDVHFSLKPPVARSAEKEWLDAQDRPWREVRKLQRQHGNIPVVIAGDIVNKFHCEPELISFMLGVLPDRVYACYGNHDLPFHNPAELKRSAYFTLMKAGKIVNLEPGKPIEISEGLPVPVRLRGFPYGSELTPLQTGNQSGALCIDVAIVHRYCWAKGRGDHPHAKEEDRAKNIRQALAGFDVALIGDNHTPFKINKETETEEPTLVNCGAFIRRSHNERTIEPSCWLVMSDGTVQRHRLDCSEDKWLDPKDMMPPDNNNAMPIDFEAFANELANMRDAGEAFTEEVKRVADKYEASKSIRERIARATRGKGK